MLRIVPHIEHLLFIHDCVIVPKFGGFVLRSVSASFDVSKQLFYPPHKEVSFNVTLQHCDGLMAESYMQQYGVSYKKAQSMIDNDVAELKVYLQENNKISFETLGAFSLGEEGQIVYKNNSENHFDISHYGMSSFSLLPLDVIVENESKPKIIKPISHKDTVYIPVNRKLLRVVSASAAAIALFFLVSTPVKEVNHSAYKASFVPTELSFPATSLIVPTTPDSMTNVEEEETTETIISKEIEKKSVEAKTVVAEKKNAKMFHIVIGSFPTEKQADEFLSGVNKADCKNVNKILRNGKYRIYADRFDNRKDAETYMVTLRNNPKYKDAWLFISK